MKNVQRKIGAVLSMILEAYIIRAILDRWSGLSRRGKTWFVIAGAGATALLAYIALR